MAVNTKVKDLPESQQDFIKKSCKVLGLTQEKFAARISIPWGTLRKWLLPSDSNGFREMPAAGWSLVREVIAHEALKARCQNL